AGHRVAEPSARPTGEQRSLSQILPEAVPSADFEEGVRRAAAGFGIVTNRIEQGLEPVGYGQGRRMSGFDRAGDRRFDQPLRRFLAEQPMREGKVDRSSDARIMTKAELGLAIAFGVEYPQRLLKMGSGHGKIPLKEAGRTQAAA